MRKFGEQFSVRYNNSGRAVVEVCRNILNYNPNLPSMIESFEVTREQIEDKALSCERIVALKDAAEAFAQR